MFREATPVELYVANQVGMASPAVVVAWAETALSSSRTDDPVLIELAGLTRAEYEEAPALLRQIVDRQMPQFDVRSEEGERIARRLFAEYCRAYLRGGLRPEDFCGAVRTADWVYEVPLWIGDLWHACDWLDPASSRQEVPHLAQEVRRWLTALEGGAP